RHSKELRPVLPIHVTLAGQAQVSLVHERGGLESVIRALPPHVGCCQAMELVIDLGHNGRGGLPAPVPHLAEKLRDVPIGASYSDERLAVVAALGWHHSKASRPRAW